MRGKDILGSISGFLIIIGGIFLLHAFRDMPISWRDVSASTRKQLVMPTQPDHNGKHKHLDSDLDGDLRETNNSINMQVLNYSGRGSALFNHE